MPRQVAENVCDLDAEKHAASTREAESVGLVFASDCLPGIRRVGNAQGGFDYVREDGHRISDDDHSRIARLAIPPAWTDVWICGDPLGHLQATGRDARGRKQYRYHEDWRQVRDRTKFSRLADFGAALPAIRRRVDRDLRSKTISRERVLALVVSLMDLTLLRVGNAEYARDNDSFGLTTLRDEHAKVGSIRVQLVFRGKAGKELEADVRDSRIARALRRAKDLPGEDLFQYLDDSGKTHSIGSADVNAYLAETTGSDFTSKYFRTWGGTLAAACVLRELSVSPPTQRGTAAAIRAAADALHNTPAIARRSYVHPAVLDSYLEGEFGRRWANAEAGAPSDPLLAQDERVLLGMLRGLGAG